jgi:hypothetical protein
MLEFQQGPFLEYLTPRRKARKEQNPNLCASAPLREKLDWGAPPMSDLPINIGDLLRQRTVEGERIEYKTGLNPAAIMRTLCAFANDFENLGGGYVVIGQD